MLQDARLLLAKDLRIERTSRVLTGQVLPFGLLVLILFGFALSPDLSVEIGSGEERPLLAQAAPGLFWVTVLLAALLALGRSFAIESTDGKLDALRMAGLDPAGIFLGKAAAIGIQLLALQLVLGLGAFVFYNVPLADPVLLAAVVVSATVAVTVAGTLYAALASGLRVRDTLLPILLLPVLAPVLLAATLGTEAAVFGGAESAGWFWTMLLVVFALVYLGIGMLSFGSIMEET